VTPEERAELFGIRYVLTTALDALERLLASPDGHALPSGDVKDCQHPKESRVSAASQGHPDAFLCGVCGQEVE
jgi:hypothetical protein